MKRVHESSTPDGLTSGGGGALRRATQLETILPDSARFVKQYTLAGLISQAQRLAYRHDQAAAQAALDLAFHTDAADRHRRILSALRGLSGVDHGR